MKDKTVQFLQLVCIFTELVPKVLLDVLTHHIALSEAFRKEFNEKPWDGGQKHREWLATMMKNSRVPKFSCAAVREERATEWDVTNLSAAMSAVMEPSEVGDIIKVRQLRNALYHRNKTEVSVDEFTQCVTSVRCLIEQALRPYFPKERSEGYLADLDKAESTEDFRERCSNYRAVLELFQKASKELECVMKQLEGVSELQQAMSQQRKEMELLKSELTAAVRSLEGKVDDLQSGQDSLRTDVQGLQMGQDSLSQRMQEVETQSQERLSCVEKKVNQLEHVVDSHDEAIKPLQVQQHPPPVTEQSPADLLKEKVYEEYQGFKVEGNKSNADYVKLAVVEKPPSSKPKDVEDKMEAMRRFKHCGTKVADEKALQIESVDLLKKGNERIRIVYGQAGSGKTTLLKQMCRALSCGEAESEFDLVLYFPLRDALVSNASDLRSLLRYYRGDDSRLDHTALAQSLVESKGRGFLLVFDGADEVKDLPPILQHLLHRKSLPESHIIISSRPGACPSLQDHSATFYEVQGFDRPAITSYVKGFFETTSSAADSMLSQLETRPDLMGGAYIPMNTYILCSIFDPKSASFPATMTACYQAFVAQTISRECRREGREVYIDPTLKDLPAGVDDLMMSLGKLAFGGLYHIPPLFIFDEPSIRTAFPTLPPGAPIDESVFKGLLHVHASRQGYQSSVSCSFPHTTQQEFFAALHLSYLPAKEQERFWQENLSNVSFSVVLRLYAGLTGLSVPKVTKQLRTAAESHGLLASFLGLVKGGIRLVDECSNDNPQLLFLFHALYESRNLPRTKQIMQHIPSSLEFRLSLSAFDTMAIAHCLSQCSHLRLLNLPAMYCTLLSPQCLSHLTEVLQHNPQCQLGDELDLRCDHFSASDAQTLADIAVSLRAVHLWVSHTECTALSTVCSLPSVTELWVTVHSDVKDDSGWPLVESSLTDNKQLEVLRLHGCDALLVNMGKALSKNTSIRTLHLSRAPLPDDVDGTIGTCVAAMTQLTKLVMGDLSLHVTKTLADRTQPLEQLFVWPPGVNWDGFSEEQWMEAEEAIATAKVLRVDLCFDAKSTHRQRAVTTITDGLALNKFVREAQLYRVPEEMRASVEQKLCHYTVYVD